MAHSFPLHQPLSASAPSVPLAIRVTGDTVAEIGDAFLGMMFLSFALVMTLVAGIARQFALMAFLAISTGVTMVEREAMGLVKRGWLPGRRGMAFGAICAEETLVIAGFAVAGDAILGRPLILASRMA